jgi:hypothetical protein
MLQATRAGGKNMIINKTKKNNETSNILFPFMLLPPFRGKHTIADL